MKTASATAAAITGTVAALSDRELLAQTGNLARVERHLQGAIIDHLAEIEARSLFLRRGFASLFEYAVRELGYSDAAAGRRIAAMRLCADNPQTRERLRDGSLSLSAAAELQWAFDRQRRRVPAATTPAVAALPTEPPLVLDAVGRQKLVEEAAGKSTRQVKRMLADLDPELAAAADRVRPLGNGRYELKALIDAECQRGLEQLAGLLSHVDPRMTVGQLVGRLVREALDRHDPSRRRPRTGSRPADAHAHAAPTPAAEPDRRTASPPKQTARPAVSATSTAQTRPGCDGHAAAAPKSRDSGRAIPAAVKREVWQRDGGRCRYVDPHIGRRCTSRHLLQIDHVLPYGLGGGSDPANLRLLCHAHHRHRHRSASAVSPTRNPEDPPRSHPPTDKQAFFVVHGLNQEARNALFTFLRSIALRPLEWSEAVKFTGRSMPYIGAILDAALSRAHAVVVLLTPDDEACLRPQFRSDSDPPQEVEPSGQARPNVLFEASMAMGRNHERTILVELGVLRPFSDIAGLHVIRLDNTPQRRQDLAQRLQTAGCPVNLGRSHR